MKGPQGRAQVCWRKTVADRHRPCWVLWPEVAGDGLVGVCMPARGSLGRALNQDLPTGADPPLALWLQVLLQFWDIGKTTLPRLLSLGGWRAISKPWGQGGDLPSASLLVSVTQPSSEVKVTISRAQSSERGTDEGGGTRNSLPSPSPAEGTRGWQPLSAGSWVKELGAGG